MSHPFVPLYVDDFEAATAHLTLAEDGAYNRLLRLCWRTPGCSLPNDPAWIARKIRLSPAEFEAIARPVIDEFFTLSRDRLIQKRLKAEYDEISRKKSARVNAGKKGGDAKARKTKRNDAGNATDLPADTRAYQNHNQNHIQKEDSPQPPEGPTPDPVRQAFDLWNDLAERCDLPKALSLSDSRRRSIARRLKEAGPDGWRQALGAVELSAFCRGQRGGRDGKVFKADLDFVCQAKSFQRLVEGFYGVDAKQTQPPARPVDGLDPWRRRLRVFQADGTWDRSNDGPAPGRPGCTVPEAVLREFGYEVTGEQGQLIPFDPAARRAG